MGTRLPIGRFYTSDPEFNHTYNTLLEGKQVPNFHLQDTLLCHLGHLCVPSRECAKMIWEVHYIWVTDISGSRKQRQYYRSISIGRTFNRMPGSASSPALVAPFPNRPSRSKASILRCVPLVDLGNPSPWITCRVLLLLIMEMTVFLWSSTYS